MPYWLRVSLLAVFAIHFFVFLSLFFVRKDRYFAFVALTFLLLVVSYSARLWLGHVGVAGVELSWAFRIAAWAMASINVFQGIRRYSRKRKGPVKS